MINIKLITRIFKVMCLISLILMFTNSCESNPLSTEPEIRLTTQDFHSMMPGELPQPMIVGGTQVNPACPNCKHDFMVSLQ